ncbi:MAG: hypothetical protein ACM3QY_12795 [Candidatus Levyibacteriota bacterium]
MERSRATEEQVAELGRSPVGGAVETARGDQIVDHVQQGQRRPLVLGEPDRQIEK